MNLSSTIQVYDLPFIAIEIDIFYLRSSRHTRANFYENRIIDKPKTYMHPEEDDDTCNIIQHLFSFSCWWKKKVARANWVHIPSVLFSFE